MQSLLKFIFLFAATYSAVNAHMKMVQPTPRGTFEPIDYDLQSPLGPDRPYPCGGKPAGKVTATMEAGKYFDVQLGGGAPHDGGHCQFGVSYDQKTWVVIHTVVRECMRKEGLNYKIKVPADIPSSEHAVFAWTWINSAGNREYYMNCADIRITGSQSKSLSGLELFIGNIDGHPIIPEMDGNVPSSKDGRQYLSQRKTITFTPNNENIEEDSPNNTNSKKEDKKEDKKEEPKCPSVEKNPAPLNTNSICSKAQTNKNSFYCDNQNDSIYIWCFPQGAEMVSQKMNCPKGTICLSNNSDESPCKSK